MTICTRRVLWWESQKLTQAAVASNTIRKDSIDVDILLRKPRCVGVYRLVMKAGSDNFTTRDLFDVDA